MLRELIQAVSFLVLGFASSQMDESDDGPSD